MYDLNCFYSLLDEYAPLSISKKMIEGGDYDNSGILVKNTQNVTGALFTLDLTTASVTRAKAKGVNTIVTHHPAIYNPISSLGVNPQTCALLSAIKNGFNVISMHLNLDCAVNGIDSMMAKGLGASEYKILDMVDDKHGYGREFIVNQKLSEIVKRIKKEFQTNKLLVYGNKNRVIKKIASFCGAGSSVAMKCLSNGKTDADLIVTADVPHHVIKELVEKGVSVIVMPHYVSEVYGFKEFYNQISKKAIGLKTYFFDDIRFR